MTDDDRTDHLGISVVIITLNEEENVADLLDSMECLDYPSDRYEVVVVDASTDSTPTIVQGYPGVRLIRAERTGFASQKNSGIENTVHEIVAFTDADCEVPSDWLHIIDSVMRDGTPAAIGGNAYAPPGATFTELCFAAVGHPGGGAVGLDGNVTLSEGGIDFIAGCNSVYRRSALEDVGLFDPAFDRGGEDVDVSRRLRAAGYRLEYEPALTVYHMPRAGLREYWRWNMRVGETKHRLYHPSLLRVLSQPSFPLWSLLIVFGLVWLAVVKPSALLPALLLGWISYLVFLYLMAKPYPLLLKRHKRIGLPLWACLTIVPLLIYVRQVAMSIGQLRERRKERERKRVDLRASEADTP